VLLATKGLPGWGKPAIGQPTLVDIDLAGRRVKQGCKVWGVGTWALKSDFYSFLRQDGIKGGAPRDPDGYCHFGSWVDELYFKQLTGDRLEQVKVHGRVAGQRWAQIKNNHFHDCRIYNSALAEYLGMSQMTPEEWKLLATHYGMPDELSQPTLFTQPLRPAEAQAPATSEVDPVSTPQRPTSPEATQATDNWIGRDTDDWLSR
jgi:phage terminase large subunit GpA-like protein